MRLPPPLERTWSVISLIGFLKMGSPWCSGRAGGKTNQGVALRTLATQLCLQCLAPSSTSVDSVLKTILHALSSHCIDSLSVMALSMWPCFWLACNRAILSNSTKLLQNYSKTTLGVLRETTPKLLFRMVFKLKKLLNSRLASVRHPETSAHQHEPETIIPETAEPKTATKAATA